MNAQQATEKRTSRALKPRYLIMALSLLALVFVCLAMRPDSSNSLLMKQLPGTWVLPTGNSATINANGTAADRRSDGTAAGQYRWSLAGNVISFERVQKRQNLMDSVEEYVERFVGDTHVENYRIDRFNEDSMTLTNQENNSTILWNRVQKEGTDIQD